MRHPNASILSTFLCATKLSLFLSLFVIIMSFFSQNVFSVSSSVSSGGGRCRRVKDAAASTTFNTSSKMNAKSRTSGRRCFTRGGKRIVVLAEDDGEAKRRIGFNALNNISTKRDKTRARAFAEEEKGGDPSTTTTTIPTETTTKEEEEEEGGGKNTRGKATSKGATPLLVVDMEKGTVKLAKNRRRDKAKLQGALALAVKRSEVKLADMGSAKIGPLEEDDCMDATNLVMDLFFKVRPQDFLARKRLAKAQSDRVYAGLLDGVQNATDRVLIAAKVGSNLVGIAEVSLPNGKRFGAENYRPKAPADKPYLSDVAVATTQRGRGIGKALVLAAEETMREMGETTMYTHTKVDNKGAQKLFEKCGYAEPEWAKKGLTQAQIAQRSTEWNPFAAVGLVEVGHFMLEKPLGQ